MQAHCNKTKPITSQLTDLFGPGFVADCGFEMQRRSAWTRRLTPAADQHPETRLLEYRRVVVVGISHRPAADVFHRFAVRAGCVVRSQTVAVWQHLKSVVLKRLQLRIST